MATGDPVTHFNLDQLLEIVQSFQFDSNMSSQEKSFEDLNPRVNDDFKLKYPADIEQPDLEDGPIDRRQPSSESNLDDGCGCVMAIHSCPNSPTETDSSSGFSTLRRRSVTLTEKIRTNGDGKKVQVIRQYGSNSTSTEAKQSTYQQKLYTFENKPDDSTPIEGGKVTPMDAGNVMLNPQAAPEYSSTSTTFTSSQPKISDPNMTTVMFNTKDYSFLGNVSVMEIIDELQRQFIDKSWDFQGVRMVSDNVYICLSQPESLQHMTTYGFYLRGVRIKLVDAISDSIVVCMSGVPHYISDSTVTMLVNTFGTAIGEVEKRFYKGVDTGERSVRLKPRKDIPVPDQVTVGGCKISIKTMDKDSDRKSRNAIYTDEKVLQGTHRQKVGHFQTAKYQESGSTLPVIYDESLPSSVNIYTNTLLKSTPTVRINPSYSEEIDDIQQDLSSNFPTLPPPPYKPSSSACSSFSGERSLKENCSKEDESKRNQIEKIEASKTMDSSSSLGNQSKSGKQISANFDGTPQSHMKIKSSTSKALNGILRKSSVKNEEVIPVVISKDNIMLDQVSISKDSPSDCQPSNPSKSKKPKSKSNHSSFTSKSESPLNDKESNLLTKSSSKSQLKTDKTGKDLSLTRDLPWCGCWGNGCL